MRMGLMRLRPEDDHRDKEMHTRSQAVARIADRTASCRVQTI